MDLLAAISTKHKMMMICFTLCLGVFVVQVPAMPG